MRLEGIPEMKKPNDTTFTFRLPQHERDTLEYLATQANESMGEYIRHAITQRRMGGIPAGFVQHGYTVSVPGISISLPGLHYWTTGTQAEVVIFPR